MYCTNATKTTITYLTTEGTTKRYIAPSGVSIECADSPRTGKYVFTVHDGGYNADCSPQHEITFYTNTFVADSYTVDTGTSPYPNLIQCSWVKLTFYVGDDISASQNFPLLYQVNQANNPNYSPGGKALVIKDSSGNQLLKAWAKDCNFTVACGDECPPEHIKCECSQYPGYCCIPCSEIGSEISSATATLRRMNNG